MARLRQVQRGCRTATCIFSTGWDQNGAEIYKTKSGFSYFKIQSGEQIRVCMTSDFFLEEADPWRSEAWDIMRQHSV